MFRLARSVAVIAFDQVPRAARWFTSDGSVQFREQSGFTCDCAVELDANSSSSAGFSFEDPGDGPKACADSSRLAFMSTVDPPDGVSVSLGDVSSRRRGKFANTGHRQEGGIIVDAKLCGRRFARRDHVGFIDPLSSANFRKQAGDAGVGGVGNLRKQQWNIEAELLCHSRSLAQRGALLR
ncbi:hypothetical protein [Brevundimonas mediterranea]